MDSTSVPTVAESVPDYIGGNFKIVVLASNIGRLATSGFSAAIVWIMLIITGSPVLAGFADGMGALPLFLSFAFGAYVDGLNSKRSLSILTSTARVAALIVLYLALQLHSAILETIAIYAVVFLIGMTTDIMNSVVASWTKQFLHETQYKKGTALMQSTASLAQTAGFAVSGALIIFGPAYAVLGFFIIFAISVVPLFFLKNEETQAISGEHDLRSSLRSGIKFIFSESRLRALILITLVVNFAFGTVGIFFAVLVNSHFGLPAFYYTMLLLSLTLGIFVGSALGTKVKGKAGFYTIIVISVLGICLILMGFVNSIFLDYPISAFMGVLIGIINVAITAGIVKVVEQEMMGRTMGAISTFAISLTFVSGAMGGLLISAFNIHGAFYLIGAVLIAASLLPLVFKDFYNLEV